MIFPFNYHFQSSFNPVLLRTNSFLPYHFMRLLCSSPSIFVLLGYYLLRCHFSYFHLFVFVERILIESTLIFKRNRLTSFVPFSVLGVGPTLDLKFYLVVEATSDCKIPEPVW